MMRCLGILSDLQDNPKSWWKASVIADVIAAHVAERNVDVVS